MPNSDTFSQKATREFVKRWLYGRSTVVDPFARNCELANYTNDLNPETKAKSHLDAREYLTQLIGDGVRADLVIFDPPYSPRQISECYKIAGRKVTTADTQNAKLYRQVRDLLDQILKVEGIGLSFGWNSTGFGKGRGYTLVDLLLVNHGAAHNDTICLAEVKGEKVVSPIDDPNQRNIFELPGVADAQI
jgi:hypothetical protein